jgi:hypothetical protein
MTGIANMMLSHNFRCLFLELGQSRSAAAIEFSQNETDFRRVLLSGLFSPLFFAPP